jgi:hypothetical protein
VHEREDVVPIKEFVTALRAAEEPDEEHVEFTIDGHVLKCYRPSPAQLAYAMSAVGRRRETSEKVAGIIDFFVEVLDEESQAYVENRLLNRKDPFGLDEVEQVLEWMVEEWTARPTEPPSGSTRSRSNGGRKSTRPTTRPTSSGSASTGS